MIKLLRKFLGLDRSVASITSPITSIINELKSFADEHKSHASAKADYAAALLDERDQHVATAKEATTAAEKIADAFGMVPSA